jgi:hypothetical protein
MGFQPKNCIGKPEPLIGYQGDYRTADGEGHTKDASKAMKADIIIPRAQVGGASNDIGFRRGPDGKYGAIISDYDSSRYNAEWMTKLRAAYTDKGIMKSAAKAGLKLISKAKNPVTQKMDYQFLKA